LLLGATLLFWGWETGFPLWGALMGVVLEGARWSSVRWELSEQDFTRIWVFCCLLCLGAAVYAFTSNEGPSDISGFLQNPNLFTQRSASNASARSVASVIRWLPMIFFLFVAAQEFSTRGGIARETVSLILRFRWKRAHQPGQPPPPTQTVDISYPFFALCLLAASIRTDEDNTYFWGVAALVPWALWPQRTRRFSLAVWLAVLVAAVGLGYGGQRGIGQFQRYLGSFNPEWLANLARRGSDPLQSRTAIGRIGRIKLSRKIIIRLEQKSGLTPPAYLRETSYRTYKAQVWYSETSEKDFDAVREEPVRGTYVLLPGKTNSSAVNISCYLDGGKALLPLPAGSGRIENLTAYVPLEKSSLGAVLAEGPGLVVFDAWYGPGATIDSPGNSREDLAVPPRETNALAQVVSELHLQGQNRAQTLRMLNGFFADKFAYSTWQEPRRSANTNETPLTRFLLTTRRGHCEYFATAGVLLLRQVGIPARYVVGYAVHEGAAGKYVVRARDAHAWCLVWNPHTHIWQDFDPTPAAWVAAESKRTSLLDSVSDLVSRITFELSKIRWGQSHLRRYVLWSLAPVLAGLLYQIIFRTHRRRRSPGLVDASVEPDFPGLDSEFYQLERSLAGRGAARQPGELLSQWLARAVQDPALAGARAALLQLLRLHYRYRVDPHGLPPDERDQLRREARACLAKLT
jgi:protein-glutamine gamma-glutamyltransferase